MRPRIKVITLGVSDLKKSLAFYRDGMGLPTQGIIGTEFENGAVVFFEMNDDLVLALWPRLRPPSSGRRSSPDYGLPHGPSEREDLRQAEDIGDQQDQEHDQDHAEDVAPGGQLVHAR